MSNRKIGFCVAAALVLLVTGCGRAASPFDPAIGVEEEIPALPPGLVTTVSADKVRPTPTPAVGVEVDGRWYPKGQEPKAVATPAPAAPQAGKGHLHLSVSLANRQGGWSEKIVLSVTQHGQTAAAYTRTFQKAELVGTKLSATATDLAPGDYTVSLQVWGKTNVIKRDAAAFKVEADKTAEGRI
ncbi:MAG: hypothetical protein ACK46X_17305 [Candidatus Sericytochromatia bacterium]